MHVILVVEVDILLHVHPVAAGVVHHVSPGDDDDGHRPICHKVRNRQKSEAAEKQKSCSWRSPFSLIIGSEKHCS
jgi:hypothetical protein